MVVTTVDGIICASLSSYTETITFFVSKLWVVVLVVTFVNVSVTVDTSATSADTFVNPLPSPTN